MSYFLRGIRQQRWYRHPDIPWLPQDELQADALLDIRPQGNSLSIYQVRNKADENRVAIALAAKRDNLDHFDYAIFEDAEFGSLGLNLVSCDGETPDEVVNSLHHDLRNLTVTQLAELAGVISIGRQERIPRKDLRPRLVEEIQAGALDRDKMNPKLLLKLQ